MKPLLPYCLLLTVTALSCHRAPRPAGPIGPIDAASSLEKVTDATRLGYIRAAHIWRPIETASLDLLVGPPRKDAFAFDAQVECDYVDDGPPMTGHTPKFLCRDGDQVYKVKYGDKNGEVFAEAAATRLFWALGFGTDTVYPVQVVCRNCPMDPWLWKTAARFEERSYRLATIERKFDAVPIESKAMSGWSWPELDLVDSSAGGAPVAHRDALKLLAVLVQHGDNKTPQQRLVCLPDGVSKGPRGERCTRPFLMVADLGATFGQAGELAGEGAKLVYAGWTRKGVFKPGGGCVGDLDAAMRGSLQYPEIREAGRRFLADRLALLSDRQIRDIFTAARADSRDESVEEGGVKRRVTVEDWVQAFKKKRQEIADRRCPE
jgi:hypothetical protein